MATQTGTSASGTAKKSSRLTFKEQYSTSMGMVIGTGIITSTGICIGYTGSGVWLGYALAGILIFFCYLPTFIGASVVPKTSAMYFMCNQVGRWLGGMYTYMTMFSCISIGFMGTSFANYMATVVDFGSKRFWGLLILTIFFLSNLLDHKSVVKVETLLNVVLIAAWLSFIFLGLPKVDFGVVFSGENMFPNGGKGMWEAICSLIFAMSGGTWLVNSGERIENPERNIILGNMACTGTAIVLFAFVSFVAAGVLPLDEVAGQPLTLVAKAIYPGSGYLFFVIGGALMALATTINARYLATANSMVRSCNEGWFPKVMSKQNQNHVPYVFLTVVWVIAILPVLFNIPTALLNKMSSAATNANRVLPNLAVWFLLKNFPDAWKNSRWHMPKPVFTVIYVCSNVLLVSLVVTNFLGFPTAAKIATGILLGAFLVISIVRAPKVEKIVEARRAQGID